MKTLAKNLLLLATLAGFLVFFAGRFSEMQKGVDFPDFYSAARMVREGMGRQLYQPSAQQEFQTRYAGRVGTYFIHPPYETLIFLPFTGSTPEHAYLLWCLLNVALLIGAAKLLREDIFPHTDWRLLLLVMLSFTPVLLNFLQGQDSVLLFFFELMAFRALKQKRAAMAGALLACGLFKFHLILPLTLMVFLCIQKKLRFMAGLLGSAVFLGVVSSAVSGWEWFIAYPRFLVQLKDLPMAGIHPDAMANLRGLLTVLFPDAEIARVSLLVFLSLLLVILAVRGWRQNCSETKPNIDLAFSNAVIASILVGYHLSPHDLSLLILPMALIFTHMGSRDSGQPWLRYALWSALAVLVLPPVHILLLRKDAYTYMSVPMLILFFATVVRIEGPPGPSTLASPSVS